MKKCPNCQQTYTDESLNFCLNDGMTLETIGDAPPTVFMNRARTTGQMNWGNAAPPTVWTNPQMSQSPAYLTQTKIYGQNQTLPTVSLVTGILSLLLCCFFGGFPLGGIAAVTGYLGLKNERANPQEYGGRGLAIAGIITGGIGIVASIFYILAAIAGDH